MAQATEKQQAEQETIAGPADQTAGTQLRIDDSDANVCYSSISRVAGTAEEILIDFAHGVRPTGDPGVAVLKVDSRVILSPWAAKRLALALGQAIHRYEQTYGELEIDHRKRAKTS
jgi:hypothetical protein